MAKLNEVKEYPIMQNPGDTRIPLGIEFKPKPVTIITKDSLFRNGSRPTDDEENEVLEATTFCVSNHVVKTQN